MPVSLSDRWFPQRESPGGIVARLACLRGCERAPHRPSCALFDGDVASHARPVVVGAPHIVVPGPQGYEVKVPLLVRLEHDLGALTVQGIGIAHLYGFEEIGGGQFVQLAAVVFDVQPIGGAAAKDQVARLKGLLGRG